MAAKGKCNTRTHRNCTPSGEQRKDERKKKTKTYWIWKATPWFHCRTRVDKKWTSWIWVARAEFCVRSAANEFFFRSFSPNKYFIFHLKQILVQICVGPSPAATFTCLSIYLAPRASLFFCYIRCSFHSRSHILVFFSFLFYANNKHKSFLVVIKRSTGRQTCVSSPRNTNKMERQMQTCKQMEKVHFKAIHTSGNSGLSSTPYPFLIVYTLLFCWRLKHVNWKLDTERKTDRKNESFYCDNDNERSSFRVINLISTGQIHSGGNWEWQSTKKKLQTNEKKYIYEISLMMSWRVFAIFIVWKEARAEIGNDHIDIEQK